MKHGIYKLLGVAALSFFGLAAQAQDIKLGFNGDLSASPSAQSGQAAVLGMEAAIEDINAAGGVLGRKLTLVMRDDLSQPPKSIQNMSDLIDNEKVVAVFGPTNSGNAMAWKHIANQKKIPVHRQRGLGHRHHQADEPGCRQLHVPRLDGRPRAGRRPDGLRQEEPGRQGRRHHGRDHRLRPGRPEGHAGDRRAAGHQAGGNREVRRRATPT